MRDFLIIIILRLSLPLFFRHVKYLRVSLALDLRHFLFITSAAGHYYQAYGQNTFIGITAAIHIAVIDGDIFILPCIAFSYDSPTHGVPFTRLFIFDLRGCFEAFPIWFWCDGIIHHSLVSRLNTGPRRIIHSLLSSTFLRLGRIDIDGITMPLSLYFTTRSHYIHSHSPALTCTLFVMIKFMAHACMVQSAGAWAFRTIHSRTVCFSFALYRVAILAFITTRYLYD